jgi:hypothetical protein
MLIYGCTRLEIGVQSTYEDVARDTNRGHTVAAVADCFSLAKDAGFKVIAHWPTNSSCLINFLIALAIALFRPSWVMICTAILMANVLILVGGCAHDARFT